MKQLVSCIGAAIACLGTGGATIAGLLHNKPCEYSGIVIGSIGLMMFLTSEYLMFKSLPPDILQTPRVDRVNRNPLTSVIIQI